MWSRFEQERLEDAVSVGDAKNCLDAIAKGADPDRGVLGVTSLMVAAVKRDPALVEALLPFSDASLAEGREGRTALSLAAEAGCARCVELLARASSALAGDAKGSIPLMRAAERGRAQAVAVLLSRPDAAEQALAQDRQGLTALMRAFGHPSCALLLAPLSDLEAKSFNGVSALAWIQALGGDDLARRLRELKALKEGEEIANACASAAGGRVHRM